MIKKITEVEVLTLEEAAAFLRVAPQSVERLALEQRLPGRQIDGEWRFLKDGLRRWLVEADARQALLQFAGAFQDDPALEALTEEIYRERGRPIQEPE